MHFWLTNVLIVYNPKISNQWKKWKKEKNLHSVIFFFFLNQTFVGSFQYTYYPKNIVFF